MGWRARAAKGIDWIERASLEGMFSRCWEDEINVGKNAKGFTNAQLRKFLDRAERKIIRELRKIKIKEYNAYKDGQ